MDRQKSTRPARRWRDHHDRVVLKDRLCARCQDVPFIPGLHYCQLCVDEIAELERKRRAKQPATAAPTIEPAPKGRDGFNHAWDWRKQ